MQGPPRFQPGASPLRSSPQLGLSSPTVSEGSKQDLKGKEVVLENEEDSDEDVPKGKEATKDIGRPSVEDYEDRVNAPAKHDYPELIFFPENDVVVATEKRKFRTEISSVSESVNVKGLEGFVKDSLKVFTTDWQVVHRNYIEFDGKSKLPAATINGLPPEESPNVAESSNIKGGSGLDPELLEPPALALKKRALGHLRGADRMELFHGYSLTRNEKDEPSDARTIASTFPEKPTTEFLVDCKDVSFSLGAIEPFFCSLCLVDVQRKIRLSETFHFHLNPEPLMKLLHGSGRLGDGEHVDAETETTRALFSVSHANAGTYLLLRIERIVKGDTEAGVDAYFKHTTMKPKERAKLVKEAEATCARLGKYTQPFAWSAVPVFDERGNFILERETVFRDLVRIKNDHTDEKLYELIKKKEKETKLKPIPGQCKLEVTLLDAKGKDKELPGRIDPSYLPVIPTSRDKLIREVASFVDERAEPQPCLSYVNHLYVYLEHVNLSKYKGKGARNIGIRVQLKENDSDPLAPGLPVFYGTSSHAKFVNYADTAVTYQNKKPVFYQEMKLELPSKLGPGHHLLFTFFNVGIKPKTNAETICGHAILPLLDSNGRIIADEQRKLPVASSLPLSYRAESQAENITWLDNMRPQFIFRTKLVSTVFTQDEHLHRFFVHHSTAKDDFELCQALENLGKVGEHVHVQFFPVILNQLWEVMCNRSSAAARQALITLPSILRNVEMLTLVSGRRTQNPYLSSYVHLMFDLPKGSKGLLFQEIVRHWIALLNDNHVVLGELAQYSWFIFDIIIKSMTLHLHVSGKLGDKNWKDRFGSEYGEDLSKLTYLLMRNIKSHTGWSVPVAQDLNKNIALFFKDLLSLIDRGLVFSMIDSYVRRLCPETGPTVTVLAALKFVCLRIICDHEHYIPLNLPVPQQISAVPAIPSQFWKAHFLSGLLINQVIASLLKEKLIRSTAIMTLRRVLYKHDVDERYKHQAKKERIANIYFPYLVMVLDRAGVVMAMDEEERRDWLICLVWVVKNCSLSLLRQWWKKEANKNLKAFFLLLASALQTFKEPHLKREISFTALEVVETYMVDFSLELTNENGEHMENMFGVLSLLLQTDESVSFSCAVYSTVRDFIHAYPKALFRWKNTSYCGDLCFEVLRHCNFTHPVLRTKASSLYFLLLKANFAEMRGFSRTRLQSTIAVSRLTSIFKDYTCLEQSLNAVSSYARRELPKEAQAEVDELCKKLMAVIKHSLQMAEHAHDPEMTADLYYQVSTGYTDSPDLRVTWLENLCTFHLQQGNMEEAVQCKVHIAALISEYLTKLNGEVDGVPANQAAFAPVSPNITSEKGLPNVSLHQSEEEGMYNPKTFSEEGLVRIIRESISIAKDAQLYEQVIDLYKYLLAIHQKERDYSQLSQCFRDLKQVAENLVKANQGHARLFGNYYRVAFFGKAWRELDGKEYVYRTKPSVLMGDISERLKRQYMSKYGNGKVELVSNMLDRSKMREDVGYLQVVSLTEYFDPAEAADRPNLWDKKFNNRRFIFETPFTKSGKAQGDLVEQCKRKTILTTGKAFPFVLNRLPVVKKDEVIIEPIQYAIELVEGRIYALRNELDTSPPNIKTLQQVLQGSVLVTVNAGPSQIARTFLAKADAFAAEHIHTLQERMRTFCHLCQVALILNKTLISPDQAEFQTHLENGFNTLRSELLTIMPHAKMPPPFEE
jgi:hypothetical protein